MTNLILLDLIYRRSKLLILKKLSLYPNLIFKLNYQNPSNGIFQDELLTNFVFYLSYNIPICYIEGNRADEFCQYPNLGYTMEFNDLTIKGIGKKYRIMLTIVVKKSPGWINSKIVQGALDVPRSLAQTYLSRWFKNGWIKRIKQGTYVPLLDLRTQDPTLPAEDSWVVAQALFSPCYIAGWTAAHHWGFTDQLFNDIWVFSSRKLGHSLNIVDMQKYIVKKISAEKMFGLKPLWHENTKVFVSDPHKTIIDILEDPSTGGGIRSTQDFLEEYLRSSHKNMELLLNYAKQMKNKAIFKRLGFLLTQIGSEDQKILSFCLDNISKGYSYLDPSIKDPVFLIRKWRLWVPKYYKSLGKNYD